MTQIKEGTEPGCQTGAEDWGSECGGGHREDQVRHLLERRMALREELAEVDRALATLREASASAAGDGIGGLRLHDFALRGEEFETGHYDPPRNLDRTDLEHCFSQVARSLAEQGVALPRLEILVRYRGDSGRVVSIESRRPGQLDWDAQLHRRVDHCG